MKASTALFASVLLGPCSSSTGDAPPASSSQPVMTAPVATAASPTAPPAAPPASAAAPGPQHAVAHPPPAAGPCALLAQKCTKCPPGVVQLACNGALAAGALDPSACTNALEDKDIKAECGGGAQPSASAGPAAAPSSAPAPSGSGPCALLAQKCAKCPPGIPKMACQGAVTAGALDPVACTNALADKDIKAQCN